MKSLTLLFLVLTTCVVSLPGAASPAHAGGEICDNCVDDDSDDMIDRADPECSPLANGAGQGLGDPDAAKATAKCQKGLQSAGRKFITTKLKRLHKCVNAVFKCVQQKSGDAACLTKATTRCDKEIAKVTQDEDKLRAKAIKVCSSDKMSPNDLFMVEGVGYDSEFVTCDAVGQGTVGSLPDIAECLVRQHECTVERLLGQAVPRATELLTLVGRNPAVELPCLDAGTDGGGLGLAGDTKQQKAAVKCEAAIKKAEVKLTDGILKATQKCVDTGMKCVQQKPGDIGCVAKGQRKCVSAVLKGISGTALVKHRQAIAKACGKPELGIDAIRGATGLGMELHDERCTIALDSVDDIATCLGQQHLCRTLQSAERGAPRLRELAQQFGVLLLF